MMDVALGVFNAQAVHALFVAHRAQRGDRERLRLATGEQARPVRTRQHAALDGDRPDGGQVTAIGAHLLVQDKPRQKREADD